MPQSSLRRSESVSAQAPSCASPRRFRFGITAIPGGLLLCISSPYARRGVLWNVHQKHYGKDSSTLVWRAPSREMKPELPQKVVDEAYAEDPASAAAEYGAEFRKDVETFIDAELVANLVAKGRRELPPAEDVQYVGFVDPAGGSGQDSMTLAIAHREGGRAILDCLREVKPPFSPEATTELFAEDLKRYRLGRVIGDRFAGEWPRERFRGCGIQYDLAQQTRSQIYQALLPALNSGGIELLENERLTRQLVDLERRSGWGGRESIDHGPGKHDDLINAAAGALVEATRWRPSWGVS